MYSVPQYLNMLKLAKRSPETILQYKKEIGYFARFLEVSPAELHNHLLPENLINYAASREGKSERGNRVRMSIIRRFYTINGVRFDELEVNVLKARGDEQQDDKPLDPEVLRRMMDLATPHFKAILSTLISTGMRAGECCKLSLSDLDGDCITIPNRIAKGRRGGKVYLTAEARAFLDIWLRDRDRHSEAGSHRYFSKVKPEDDKRLFCCSYPTLRGLFSRLFDTVDGGRGKYRAKCTIHSCRKYFRTHAVRTMPLDLVEKLMRHSGYLTSSYVRISDEEARRQFHEGEHALYITRSDQRITANELDTLKREKVAQADRLAELEMQQAATTRALAELMAMQGK